MNRELLCRLLGLAATASDAEINAALEAFGGTLDQLRALAAQNGQPAATTAEAVGRLGASMARLANFDAQAAEARQQQQKSAAETEVGNLVAQKRLQPSMKSFALSIHGTPSWPGFLAGLPGAPPTAQGGGQSRAEGEGQGGTQASTQTGSQSGEGQAPERRTVRDFDADELADIAAAGLTPEQARAALNRARAEGGVVRFVPAPQTTENA
jgi:catechol 2,3-dioxygenase-like lactoylglutathione lyase family enzyme